MKRARLLSSFAVVAVVAFAAPASAEERAWVDRPLTLDELHASLGVGFGVGQATVASLDGAGAINGTTQKFGTGALFDAAIGLPFFGELGARIGYRFGAPYAQGDSFARLYDHEAPYGGNGYGNAFGQNAWSNPEFRLRGTLFDAHVVQVSLETRLIAPLSDTAPDVSISPGLGVRIHVPALLRIDTGFFALYQPDALTDVVLSVPVQVWFQVNDAFFGPMTGLRYDIRASSPPPGGLPNATEIPGGLGGGYTFNRMLDVMGQVYAYNLNTSAWSQTIGAGVAVQLLIP